MDLLLHFDVCQIWPSCKNFTENCPHIFAISRNWKRSELTAEKITQAVREEMGTLSPPALL